MTITEQHAKPRTRWGFRVTEIILFVIGWVALLVASNSPLLAAIQLIGLGLGGLVSVRVVQEWGRRR